MRHSVLRWYRRHGRDLPWRHTRDPYAVLVSEIMLQQTQVSRVVPKYRDFLQCFPTMRSLAAARLRDVLHCWSGLGYNSRARRLWECARVVVAEQGGSIPHDIHALRALPGIGRYTAGAIASFAHGAAEPAVDTNIRRVLSRSLLGVDAAEESTVWRIAGEALPRDAAEWNHALMDIGALFCRAKPACDACPLRTACAWREQHAAELKLGRTPELKLGSYKSKRSKGEPYHESRRQHRGRVIRALTQAPSLSLMRLGPQVKGGFSKTDLAWLHDLLGDLERDGLVTLNRSRTRAALP
jgi:A/G-specific adenine glycosylase